MNIGVQGVGQAVGDMLKRDRALDTDQILGAKYREIMSTLAQEAGT